MINSPNKSCFQGERSTPAYKSEKVAAFQGNKAGVPVIGNLYSLKDRDRERF
jgi:hypothetical protein